MSRPQPVAIDFETFGIESRPKYPPLPVGVSIKYPGEASRYFAFGHLEGNNCCWSEAAEALERAYQHEDGVLFQNGKFDLDVAEVHFGLPLPPWHRIHDTLFLLFLDDPHQIELGLKPSATRLLGVEADEQDAVGEWLIQNQPVRDVKISKARGGKHYFGRYIAYAPGQLVGSYANGDVERTEAIFNLLWGRCAERRMLEAYDRERKLMPILLEMERHGLPVNLERLGTDYSIYAGWHATVVAWIKKYLCVDDAVNLDSSDQLIDALLAAGKVDVYLLPKTMTGKYQTGKDALPKGVTDPVLSAMLLYKSQLDSCLKPFMLKWLDMAKQSNGCVHTNWNQTKTLAEKGARTGRLSSNPNFQNIPKEFPPVFQHQLPNSELPECPLKDLPSPPNLRNYIIPFSGHVMIDRDYSQQEPRILAHFDGAALMQKYIDDPWIDFHDSAKAELEKVGKFYDRRPVKNTNLGIIYGMGLGKLAEKNNMPREEATALKKAILKLYPGLDDMNKEMKYRARANIPIRTWGGREYYCEPAKTIDGKHCEFDYKMINVLVQGSAADCTKEALIRYHAAKHSEAKIMLNVHDQITVSVPSSIVESEMEVLRQCMESVEFDVPILSEGAISDTNWNELRDYDKKGVTVV